MHDPDDFDYEPAPRKWSHNYHYQCGCSECSEREEIAEREDEEEE